MSISIAFFTFLLHFSHFYCIFSIFIAPWNRHSMMQWWHKPEQCIYIKAQKIFHILTSSIAPNKTYLEILTYMYLYLLRYHNNFILKLFLKQIQNLLKHILYLLNSQYLLVFCSPLHSFYLILNQNFSEVIVGSTTASWYVILNDKCKFTLKVIPLISTIWNSSRILHNEAKIFSENFWYLNCITVVSNDNLGLQNEALFMAKQCAIFSFGKKVKVW